MIIYLKKLLNESLESFKIAYQQTLSFKMRSLLTMLGIIIGIISVTLMGTAINGIDNGFERSMKMIGYDILYVEKFPWSDEKEWWEKRNRKNIKPEYANKIATFSQENSFGSQIKSVASSVVSFLNVKYGHRSVEGIFTQGVSSNYLEVSTMDIESGRFFSEVESNSGRSVCILGSDTKESLFPSTSALGKTLKVNGHTFVVIGTLSKQGNFLGLFSWDKQMLVPLKSFLSRFGARNLDRTSLLVKIKDKQKLSEANAEVESYMRRLRGLEPDQENDFEINEQRAFRGQIEPIKQGIGLAGIFITGLALLVGAIGIMNITFVSVKERTKEIGLRKAVGAKRRTILMQFLVESVFICLIGGAIGLSAAYGLSFAAYKIFPDFPVVFSFDLIIIGALVSIITGVIAGFAPAFQASKLDPIQALRGS